MLRWILAYAGLALAAVAGPAHAQQAPAPRPVRIGATTSITGAAYSLQGGYVREGYLLCQRHVNAQGGVLGRPIELVIHDDQSDGGTAARLYERLIAEDRVDALLGPYGTAITEAVADTVERHRRLMVAPTAATSSIWEKGRRYLVMVLAPIDGAAGGALDLAARAGLRRVAVLHQDALLPNAVARGTVDLARGRGLEVVFHQSYPNSTNDFSDLLRRIKDARPDVLVAASVRLDDLVSITRLMRELDLNAGVFSALPYGLLPDYQQRLGRDAEFAYSATFWEAGLAYPGNREFVAAYEREFNRAPIVQSAGAYAGCQILVEAIRRAGTTESDRLREAVLALRTSTVMGDFAVDERGFQVGQKAVTVQWQDGRQAVVWPDEVATGRPRLPTPPWGQR